MRLRFLSLLLFVFVFAIPAIAGDSVNASPSVSVFVQGFYDWYIPKLKSIRSLSTWDSLLKTKWQYFDPQLKEKLEDDGSAQAKAQGDIVGLDFDPFLASQDPADHYKVGSVTRHEMNYWVEVHASREGKTTENPEVICELAVKPGDTILVLRETWVWSEP